MRSKWEVFILSNEDVYIILFVFIAIRTVKKYQKNTRRECSKTKNLSFYSVQIHSASTISEALLRQH